MAEIVPSNSTTQLLIKILGTDNYQSLKLPASQVLMDDNQTVSDVMPQIITEVCNTLIPDVSGFCTWEIPDVTDKSVVLSVRDIQGNNVVAANSLITYGTAPDATYSLQIYIKSKTNIYTGSYTAIIQL